MFPPPANYNFEQISPTELESVIAKHAVVSELYEVGVCVWSV